MIEWDDIRYFLSVARSPTVRAAAERLSVTHSTVLRRIAQLEERLGTLLFEKLPSGYRLTGAGNEVLSVAEEMEASSNRFEALIIGRDQTVAGSLRVTLPPTLATYLLASDLARFARRYPDVELEIITSNVPANLTNREADVAIRVVYDRATLPLNLHGWKGPELFGGVYVSRELLDAWQCGSKEPVRWIFKDNYGIPDWVQGSDITIGAVPFKTNDAESQMAAVQQGVGITTLSCFVGDADPRLVRVPGTMLHLHGCVWVLTQGETRKTKRVRLFIDFIGRSLAESASLLAGQRPRADPEDAVTAAT